MEKEILILLAKLVDDHLYRQVYASQIKMLFDMLEREQGNYLHCTEATNKNGDSPYITSGIATGAGNNDLKVKKKN